MSIGFKRQSHAHGSGFTSTAEIDKVEKAIREKVTIKRGVDVPYCAGYSDDCKTIYVDKAVPKTFSIGGRELEVDRYLVMHEAIECTLMEHLGLTYDCAHAIATVFEEKAVAADGYDVAAYNREWDKVIRKVGSRGKYPNVPKDLDTEPYSDSNDEKTEEKMGMGLTGKAGTDHYDFTVHQ